MIWLYIHTYTWCSNQGSRRLPTNQKRAGASPSDAHSGVLSVRWQSSTLLMSWMICCPWADGLNLLSLWVSTFYLLFSLFCPFSAVAYCVMFRSSLNVFPPPSWLSALVLSCWLCFTSGFTLFWHLTAFFFIASLRCCLVTQTHCYRQARTSMDPSIDKCRLACSANRHWFLFRVITGAEA